MENQNEMELDLRELFYYLKRKIWIIVAATLICGTLGFGISRFAMTPQYTATTRVYILNKTYETTMVYSDFQVSNYMLKDYQVLITGQNVTRKVVEQLGLDMTYGKLASKITVSAEDNTRVLQIDVEDADPQLAAQIANCVREVASAQIKEIMDVDAVKLVYEAEVPTSPSSPHVMRNAVLAAALGFLAAVGVYVVMFMMDDTIRTEEDVERYLGLSTLGIIPLSMELNTAGSRAADRRKSSHRRGSGKK